MKKLFYVAVMAVLCTGCDKYLDIVPDNVPTIDYAFHTRSSAERYLYTCYSYMPNEGNPGSSASYNTADEVWYMDPINGIDGTAWNIARGLQSSNNPLVNYWNGGNTGIAYFQAIRDCNIFLENINSVVDIDDYERQRWIAEVTFLKAYYHYFLLRMYGPIPLIKSNLPLEASPDEVKIYREPLDSCFRYVVQLLDEASANENLPDRLEGTESTEQGRITRAIVLAVKADVLVTAASPLFNGGNGSFSLVDKRNIQLFNTTADPDKWQTAAEACRAAIEFCEGKGYKLYTFPGSFSYVVNDSLKKQLDLRLAITEREDNPEVIWYNTQSRLSDIQRFFIPIMMAGDAGTNNLVPKGTVAPTLKMVRKFYTDKGLPIQYDKDWQGIGDDGLRTAADEDRFYIKKGEQTVQLHFNREPRFYADLGFDRGIWFGNAANNYNVNIEDNGSGSLLYIRGRAGETSSRQGVGGYSITGYQMKKLEDFRTTQNPQMPAANIYVYNWPQMRMADLYLLYAEALNEVGGYTAESAKWINKVRERAGIPSVEESWDSYSTQQGYYADKSNFRNIIHQERSIEMAFEGKRFWDLRRWMEAHQNGNLNSPVYGWDIGQKDPQSYYKQVLLFNQRFAMRDYFWPIKISELQINPNLEQNPGW